MANIVPIGLSLNLTKSDRLQKVFQNYDSDFTNQDSNHVTCHIVIGILAVALVIVLNIAVGLAICQRNAQVRDRDSNFSLSLIFQSDDQDNETPSV